MRIGWIVLGMVAACASSESGEAGSSEGAATATERPLTGAELHVERKCVQCHAIDRKLVGPSYRAIAEAVRPTDANVARLVKAIRRGSQGDWSFVPMPAIDITESEAEVVVRWILAPTDAGTEQAPHLIPH